ncbi:MAG: hypothetical protein RIR18_1277 [Pseudomonadota bacterium]|jgi:hypothetical protein
MSEIRTINGQELDRFPVVFVIVATPSGKWGFQVRKQEIEVSYGKFNQYSLNALAEGFGKVYKDYQGEVIETEPGPFDTPEEALEAAKIALLDCMESRCIEAAKVINDDAAALCSLLGSANHE